MERLHDEKRLGELLAGQRGFIYNDFAPGARPDRPPPRSARDNVLHGAHCGYLQVSLSVAKYYAATLEEAIEWLRAHRGEEGPAWHRCSCVAGAGPGPPAAVPSTAATRSPSESATAPFREAEVERFVCEHLEREGYRAQRKVRVESGTIDAVATRDGERVVIEAKGEDRGGYGSAQMNLQMGLGQLASRMVDESSVYALAFPNTPDFRRVLRTFRGSVAFCRLSLRFCLVDRDGAVRAIEADEIPEWLDEL